MNGLLILLGFAVVIGGGLLVKKYYPESYDKHLEIFGFLVITGNFLAAIMILLTPLSIGDRLGSAFLNVMVGLVILTLVLIKNKKK